MVCPVSKNSGEVERSLSIGCIIWSSREVCSVDGICATWSSAECTRSESSAEVVTRLTPHSLHNMSPVSCLIHVGISGAELQLRHNFPLYGVFASEDWYGIHI